MRPRLRTRATTPATTLNSLAPVRFTARSPRRALAPAVSRLRESGKVTGIATALAAGQGSGR